MSFENQDLNIMELTTEADVQKCREEIEELKKERKYNAVMERIISLFNAGHTDADLMTDLAQIYYDTQDYERAETWAKNAFNRSNDLETQLFLAKIYSADDKINKMAETLNLILVNSKDKFTEEQLKTIDDLLFYIELSYEEEQIGNEFPNAARWINQDETINLAEDNIVAPEPAEEEKKQYEGEDKFVSPQKSILPKGNARSSKDIFELQQTIIKASEGVKLSEEEIYFVEKCPVNDVIVEIDNLSISLKKKILMYNFIASIYYGANKFEDAIILLKTALLIDDENEFVLRNLGFVFYKQGDKQNAKIVLMAIDNKDFIVCDLLEKCVE